MADEKTPTDWAADVKRYVPDADDGVIAKIVSYCGIALRSRDASMVAFTDTTETDRVRENFCKKKLALEDSDDVIDAAIAKVGQRMSDTPTRNRVTVYYLLAEHFGKLALFGGASAAAAVPVAPLAAAVPAADVPAAPVAPMAAPAAAAIAGSYIGGRFDAEAPPAPAAPVVPAAPAAPAIPDGAGIVSEVVEGRPKVSVYFDVGKTDIAPDFTAAVAPVKAWLDANPDDRVQLSGFSDPTGNAAANAELAKGRAQAVAAALAEQGVPAERMDLVKPDDTSDEAVDLSAARRVEITVTDG